MFDAKTIGQVIGKEAFAAINASNLPKHETMTLRQIWTHSSRAKLRALAQAGDPAERAERAETPAPGRVGGSVRAADHYPHLTQTECLQVPGVPLTL